MRQILIMTVLLSLSCAPVRAQEHPANDGHDHSGHYHGDGHNHEGEALDGAGGESGGGEPWRRGSVVRAVWQDSLALGAGLTGLAAFGLVTRCRRMGKAQTKGRGL